MGVNRLSVKLGGLVLQSPIIMLSGTFGYGEEKIGFIDYSGIGAIVTKTITLEPRKGNPQPRLHEAAGGMINTIGLQNPGMDVFAGQVFPRIKQPGVRIIVSIAGSSLPDLLKAASALVSLNPDAVELNLSCPNVEESSLMISQDASLTHSAVRQAKKILPGIPVIAKLSPSVTDIAEISTAAQEAGADMISLINTLQALWVDMDRRKVFRGGLSGPAIKPIGLRCVYDVYRTARVPVIGFGGVSEGEDVLEYILAGASAVGIGSGIFSNPHVVEQGCDAIARYMVENGIDDVNSMVGRFNEKKKEE